MFEYNCTVEIIEFSVLSSRFASESIHMATLSSFQEIQAWVRARALADAVFQIFLKEDARRDYALKDQAVRSSGSVMDNIAEGFGRGGNREFIHFLSIASGSLAEVQSQLYRILDRHYISDEQFNLLMDQTRVTGKMIGSMISYLKQSEYKGSKFHETPSEYQPNLDPENREPGTENRELRTEN